MVKPRNGRPGEARIVRDPARWLQDARSAAVLLALMLAVLCVPAPAAAESGGSTAFGIPYDPAAGPGLYAAHCASCHEHPSGRIPARALIARYAPFYIYNVLSDGVMSAMASGMTAGERLSIAQYVSASHADSGPEAPPLETPACTHTPPPLRLSAGDWNGWGAAVTNTRAQPDPGLTAQQIPRLKLKWAIGMAGTRNGEPIVVGGRLFTNDTAGSVYALDPRSGCAYWRFTDTGPARSTLTLAPLPGASGRLGAFFTDFGGILYALDAERGTLIWKVKVDSQRNHQFTGSVTVYDGVVYVPVASGDEAYAMDDQFPCCEFRGALVAVSAGTGKILWTTYTTRSEPHPFKKNRAGAQMYGPAGGAIWSAPAIDAQRGVLYVATGDSYTDLPYEGADAIIAIALKTGEIRWSRQFLSHDDYIVGCTGPVATWRANCPTHPGADADFGAAPALAALPDGRQVIVASKKSSEVYGLDPDAGGRVLWQQRLSPGGPLGGSEFGHAVEGGQVYVGISDVYVAQGARPQLTALRLADGAQVWSRVPPLQPCRWHTVFCSPGVSMAVTAIPGAVFAGSLNGWLYAYSSGGQLLWSFNTAGTFTTTTGVSAAGGVLDGGGPVVAAGMLYVHSGYWGRSGPGSVLLAFAVDGE